MPQRKTGDETEERGQVKVALSPRANAMVNRWLDRNHGWGKSQLFGLLFDRFSNMPEAVQQIVLGSVPRELTTEFTKIAADFFAEAAKNPRFWQEIKDADTWQNYQEGLKAAKERRDGKARSE